MGWIEHMKYFRCIWQTTASVLRSLHSENTKERIAPYCTGGMKHWDSRTFSGWYLDLLYLGLDRTPVGLRSVLPGSCEWRNSSYVSNQEELPSTQRNYSPTSINSTLVPRVAHSQLWPGGWWATRHEPTSLQEWGFPPLGLLRPWPRSSFSEECPSVFCGRKAKFGCPKRGRSSSWLWRRYEISDRCMICSTCLRHMKNTIYTKSVSSNNAMI